MLSSVLGLQNIYQLPADIADIDSLDLLPTFPSPHDLKYKYVIKCKAKRVLPKCMDDIALKVLNQR